MCLLPSHILPWSARAQGRRRKKLYFGPIFIYLYYRTTGIATTVLYINPQRQKGGTGRSKLPHGDASVQIHTADTQILQ